MCIRILNIKRMGRGGGAVELDSHETPIHVTTRDDINDLLLDGYEVDDDRLPSPKNKPNATGATDRPINKFGWMLNVIYRSMKSGCR